MRGNDVVHMSTLYKNPMFIMKLNKQGCDTQDYNQEGYTPLHVAMDKLYPDITDALLRCDNRQLQSSKGIYPLHLAAEKQNIDPDYFDVLDKHNVDVNIKDRYGNTPLHIASLNDSNLMISWLSTKNIVYVSNNKGNTALHLAIEHEKSNSLSSLIEHFEELLYIPNSGDIYPIHMASIKKDIHYLASILLAMKSSPNMKNASGNTALHLATASGLVGNARLLLDSGADKNAKNLEFSTPLHLAARNQPAIVAMLALRKASLNESDDHGMSPLQIAISNRNYETTMVLLKFGADVHHRDYLGYTALHDASSLDAGLVKYLIKKGVDINIVTEEGYTPLLIALNSNRMDIAEILLKHGADLNVKTQNGLHALHILAASDRIDLLESAVLFSNIKDINMRDENGKTPLDHAINADRPSNIKFLKLHGAK
eukprot:TRINITY_DN10161_c0_g1_i1.p1 TRINITY_DN10161_c0_g1~~TRINITY_DN10161_c0_g1_i1.p1  ORF type:complete len:493 (-),score=78.60 TRINITY_DN10161_c0_g1_i1:61-1341(-)